MVNFENVPYVILKGFLPYIVLAAIKKVGEASTYDALQCIDTEFNMRISPATFYTAVYGLERQGYVQKETGHTKYSVTSKGLMLLQNAKMKIKEVLPKIGAILEIEFERIKSG